MAVRIADVTLLTPGTLNILIIQVDGQADRRAYNVAAKGDIYIDHVVAVILDGDFGVPVAVRVGASLPCRRPDQALVPYVRFHVEVGAGLDLGGAGGEHIAIALNQLGVKAARTNERIQVVVRSGGGLDGEHVIGREGNQHGKVV